MAFQMPPIEIGRTVLYYIDGHKDSAPCPALVTRAGHLHVSLSVFREGTTRVEPYDGVLHVDDPRILNAYNDAGAWDYLDRDKPTEKGQVPEQEANQPRRGPGRPRKEAVA
jgi:hypothetical protein